MRLPCPFCGDRDVMEFVCRGEVREDRPGPEADRARAAMIAHVYDRENAAGRVREHWYHAAGCRRWLVVERDTRSHEVFGAAFVRPPQ